MNRLTNEQIAAQIRAVNKAMGEAIKSTRTTQPSANMGALAGVIDDEWDAGIDYEAGQLFTYKGNVGFVRQAHTSQAQWIPFTAGTESLYGARPAPDENGVYPYVYNMRYEAGMEIRSIKDGKVYIGELDSDPLTYDPADIPWFKAKEQ